MRRVPPHRRWGRVALVSPIQRSSAIGLRSRSTDTPSARRRGDRRENEVLISGKFPLACKERVRNKIVFGLGAEEKDTGVGDASHGAEMRNPEAKRSAVNQDDRRFACGEGLTKIVEGPRPDRGAESVVAGQTRQIREKHTAGAGLGEPFTFRPAAGRPRGPALRLAGSCQQFCPLGRAGTSWDRPGF